MSKKKENEVVNYVRITEDDRILLNTSKLAEIFGVDIAIPHRWEKAGCPKEGRGWWDLQAVLKWRGRAVGIQGGATAEADKLDADVKLKEIKGTLEELKLQERLNEIAPIAMMEQSQIEIFSNIRQSLLSISGKIMNRMRLDFPELALESKRIIDDEIKKALKDLSTDGIYGRSKNNLSKQYKRSNKKST